mmetsp:Transcript_19223/g.21539  ORF Transcript_19223/g.21539 Transcript_19223/m.21539 type:complete len:99 (-) Transcript_19223:64-360(-)|eukprot:CAMPEP_0205830168 /NCGR_PEP_ID=MMETSP0206-20130828/40285_1 /ASSEMBLY_ACC=CAM_ASM_000279 /TAXON_ID=36767 /ORGANISM="Euplotes focardii, Strain TN1" /LENGTH=98 /DNA_ID=CAMNT_0053133567 /DNA_START=72 /DNA_END=368 /DNA_ORIENTATION=-
MAKASIAVGLNKGYTVPRRSTRPRPSRRKGLQGKRRAIAREVAREVAGFAPYEKRMMELLRNNLDKRAMRLCKRKIGTHQRAKRKMDELAGFARGVKK